MNVLKGLFLFLICTTIACGKKEIPEPIDGTPVFFFDGQVNNEARTINAGDNDFFMFSEFNNDINEVISFTGRLGKTVDCSSNCEEELVINIRNFEQNLSLSPGGISQAIRLGNYDFTEVEETSTMFEGFEVQFKNNSAVSHSSSQYDWSINNAVFSTEENPIDTFTQLNFDVKLTVVQDTFEFCTSSITKSILPDSFPNCDVSFSVQGNPVQGVSLTATSLGTAPFIFLWNTGDTLETIELTPDTMLTYCVDVFDATGCTNSNCFVSDLTDVNNHNYCSAAFEYEIESISEIIPADTIQLSTVNISYTDTTGIFYSSLQGDQNTNSFFEITAIADFENNERGEPTKKITLRFNAILFDENGNELPIESENTVIAVAYP